MRKLAFVLSLAWLGVVWQSRAATAQEYVVHTFKCPPSTTVRLNWRNKIETQPTDFPVLPSYENLQHSASFKDSAVNVAENTVTCTYQVPQTVFQAPYTYKVHRKIISCTGQPSATIECKLKPN